MRADPPGDPLPSGAGRRDGALRFAGYAAIFACVDRGGDVIRPGAFADLPAQVPLLWQHRGRPIGAVEWLAPDALGLRVVGRIDDRDVAALVRRGALSGLSIGYRTLAAVRAQGVRTLHAVALVEVSLVAQPMQRGARVHLIAERARDGAPDMVPDPRRPRADEDIDHG